MSARHGHKWMLTGVILQLLHSSSSYFPYKSSEKLTDKTVYNTKFQYPKEETTHGVGYGHHLHPFYYQSNPPLYSCAIQGDWHPIVHHSPPTYNHNYARSSTQETMKNNNFNHNMKEYHFNHNMKDYNFNQNMKNYNFNPSPFDIDRSDTNTNRNHFADQENHSKPFRPSTPITSTLKWSDIFQKPTDSENKLKTIGKTNHEDSSIPVPHNHKTTPVAESRSSTIDHNNVNDVRNTYIMKSNSEEPVIPIVHNYLASHAAEPRSDNTEEIKFIPEKNKYVMKSNHEEPMIPIIHSYLTSQPVEARSSSVDTTPKSVSKNKYIMKSNHEEPMIPIIHSYLSSQPDEARTSSVDTSLNSVSKNKYIMKSNHEEPMIPIIHSYLTTQPTERPISKPASHRDNFLNSKYIMKSTHVEPMIPIIHSFFVSPTPQPKSLNADVSTTAMTKQIPRYLAPPPRPSPKTDPRTYQKGSLNRRNSKMNEKNLVDIFTMLQIIPESEELDYF